MSCGKHRLRRGLPMREMEGRVVVESFCCDVFESSRERTF